MSDATKPFKGSSKRHQPKGMIILYEDRDIIVVDKESGLLTMATDKIKENTAYFLLTDYVRKGNSKSRLRVFIVHRLDKDTSGVIVFAKSELAKNYLQNEWPTFQKTYQVIVKGAMPKKQDVITSYLAENNVHQMYSVKDTRKGKLSKTGYMVLKQSKKYDWLEIELLTGRKNQIRVHCAEAGCPVVGDKKYGFKGKGIKRLALHSSKLVLKHPHSKKTMEFTAKVPPYFKTLMDRL